MYPPSVTECSVVSWVGKALKNFTNHEISVTDTSEKGDGYMSEIVFVTIKGTTIANRKNVLDLVIKHGPSNPKVRQRFPVESGFETEIQVYDKVLPAFEKFQLQKNVANIFNSAPKCYLTLISDQVEVVILENLKQLGYELHDRTQAMNFDHTQLVLKEYGKLHALSFALKDQNVDEFNRISKFGSNTVDLKGKNLKEDFDSASLHAIRVLREKGHQIWSKKYEDLLEKRASDMLLDLSTVHEEKSVVTHGDCWNNNYMFKYEGNDKSSPSKVKILDWQVSGLRSPVLDLSYFIYVNSSQRELERFDELMQIYYASFSDFLKQLGSNPEQLFTFEDLKKHWKKYALYGFLFGTIVLKFGLYDRKTLAPDVYYERLKHVTGHYFEHDF